jgi:hypothetical protein
MTISSVQSNSGGPAGATSISVTLGAGVTQGNLIVVGISNGFGTNLTLPDANWQTATYVNAGGSALSGGIAYTVVTAGQAGQASWTFSWTGTHSSAWVIREWSSSSGWPAVTSVLDKTTGTSDTVSTDTIVATGSAGTTTQAVELWVAALAYGDGAQTESGLTSGFTSGVEGSAGVSQTVREAYQVTSSAGAAACQMSYTTGTANGNVGIIATFTPAAGSISPPLPQQASLVRLLRRRTRPQLPAPPAITNVNVAGAVANVSVVAPVGAVSVTTPGAVSGVTVTAPTGSESVSATVPPAGVSVAAPVGTESASVAGSPAAVSVAALPGSESVSVTGLTAQVAVAAPMGTPDVSVTGQVSGVSVAAFPGSSSVTVAGSPASVSVAAIYGRAQGSSPNTGSGLLLSHFP